MTDKSYPKFQSITRRSKGIRCKKREREKEGEKEGRKKGRKRKGKKKEGKEGK